LVAFCIELALEMVLNRRKVVCTTRFIITCCGHNDANPLTYLPTYLLTYSLAYFHSYLQTYLPTYYLLN